MKTSKGDGNRENGPRQLSRGIWGDGKESREEEIERRVAERLAEMSKSGGGKPKSKDNDVSDDEVKILEGPRKSRKRRRAEKEDRESEEIAQLRNRVKQLERERDVIAKRALDNDPLLKMQKIRTHNMEIAKRTYDWTHNPEYFTEPLRISGIVIKFGIKEICSLSETMRYGIDAPLVRITPYIRRAQSGTDEPCFVSALITVTQQSSNPKTPKIRRCTLKVAQLVENRPDLTLVFPTESFEPTDDLFYSRITISITAAVRRLKPVDGGSDARTVVVEGRNFEVSAAYLGQWSEYFRAYFAANMKEKENGVYPINDESITAKDFEELLAVIYPTSKAIDSRNFEMLLKMADRFEMAELTCNVERFLLTFHNHGIPNGRLFKLATDEYELPLLQSVLLHRWLDADLLEKELLRSEYYEQLSAGATNLVNEKFTWATRDAPPRKRRNPDSSDSSDDSD